ncbi:hypothetical protein [Pseudomonas sp. SDO52101_S400]
MNDEGRFLFLRRVASRLFPYTLSGGIFFSLTLILAACSKVYVYDLQDKQGDATGKVASLATHISTGVRNVKLVFIHGVGDHCPGYALSGKDESGWFSTKQAKKLGLEAIEDAPRFEEPIYSNEFISAVQKQPHIFDDQSYVAVRRQKFSYGSAGVNVEAIEVTWSPLTQWIKNGRLAKDFTRPGSYKCVPGEMEPVLTNHAKDDEVQAPGRLLVNRILKENVLDRNLADAAIYTGQYHTVMQLGLADALCYGLTGQPVKKSNGSVPNRVCNWNKGRMEPNTRYIFVTHSLGSRLLYDTLLGLMQMEAPGVEKAALDQAFPDADKYVNGILNKTPVIYMMANQLTFLGMANITSNDNSKSVIYKPAVVGDAVDLQSSDFASPRPEEITNELNSECNEVGLCQLALAIKSARRTPRLANGGEDASAVSQGLEIVAFHDTNDLLSWPVPPEYQRVIDKKYRGEIRFTNVFVRNAPRLLIFESPTSAHQNYFKNGDVWKTIKCGYTDGSINSPCK